MGAVRVDEVVDVAPVVWLKGPFMVGLLFNDSLNVLSDDSGLAGSGKAGYIDVVAGSLDFNPNFNEPMARS